MCPGPSVLSPHPNVSTVEAGTSSALFAARTVPPPGKDHHRICDNERKTTGPSNEVDEEGNEV